MTASSADAVSRRRKKEDGGGEHAKAVMHSQSAATSSAAAAAAQSPESSKEGVAAVSTPPATVPVVASANGRNGASGAKSQKEAGALRTRRTKRDKEPIHHQSQQQQMLPIGKKKRKSKLTERHANDSQSGGVKALVPSLIGVAVLVCGVMAKMGFRGRASVAGIDLGTTNSVICVQAPAKGVGKIECIPDPATGSPIVPSVVSFLEKSERKVGPSSKIPSLLHPHPSHVVVGAAAKRRIDSHPHHTLYHAKRVLGRPADDPTIEELDSEVEFRVVPKLREPSDNDDEVDEVAFVVPDTPIPISPQQVGSYVVHHLVQITKQYLGHENVKSAVICVPAKFNDRQKLGTYRAFQKAGIAVARVVEEPTAAALAYGLHRKEGVDYILVYDFGGGTLDVSLLHVSDGFVDVMGSDGDDRLGGADFDAAVAHFLLEKRGGNAIVTRTARVLDKLTELIPDSGSDLEDELASSCPVLDETPLCTSSSFHTLGEQLKIGLSAYPDHDGKVQATCLAPPSKGSTAPSSLKEFCASLVPVTLHLTSQEYDKSVQSLYDRSIVPIQRLLQELDLSAQDIDEVVMVGGTTRMPQIRTLVRDALHASSLNTHIDPDITVAYGAASVID